MYNTNLKNNTEKNETVLTICPINTMDTIQNTLMAV